MYEGMFCCFSDIYNKYLRNVIRVRLFGIFVCLKFNLLVCKFIKGYLDFCFLLSEYSLYFIKLFKVFCLFLVLFLIVFNR